MIVEVEALDLDVHLDRRDAVPRAGDLEVHVAEVILGAEDVGEDRDFVAFLDEPHRDAGDGGLDRHAGIEQRERAAADRGHRRRAVRLEDVRHDADRVRELLERAAARACSARSARLPWPISRRDVPRIGRTSPVENGGKL